MTKKANTKTAATKTPRTAKETFRGRITYMRDFEYTDKKTGALEPAAELKLAAPSGKTCSVQLYSDAVGYFDGLWMSDVTWEFEQGEKLAVGQFVTVNGTPEYREVTTKTGEQFTEYRITIFSKDALSVFVPQRRPGAAQGESEPPARARRPKAY